ncbi:hypothetical protein [Rhizobium sp. CECT 9324]|uniref:hypothetical protein n=1 Tax=Rhizobium sp. CECT 9324 TaxID=2845820 RepID=UPI001E46A9E9|nr:hypothetical protein [Rhizobium sp. CECT 9324]CAH0338938.1 hypothetical protein RHI9324_00573 [Rhizobium sp. CECT 9324]
MSAGPNFFVDEKQIVAVHDRMIASDSDLTRHIALIGTCLECLSLLPEFHKEGDVTELNVLRLGVRCFNSGASALRLLRCGYFQPAVVMIRDLLEVRCLMDLFVREPRALQDWLSMGDKDRMKHFKPVRVRERLDQFDGVNGDQRRAAYNLFSEIAVHPNPNGHFLISPEHATRIGPFFSYEYFRPGIEELVSHLSSATAAFCNLFETDNLAALNAKEKFATQLAKWRLRYFPPKNG